MRKLYPILAITWLLIGLPGCKKEIVVVAPTADLSSRAKVADDVLLDSDSVGKAQVLQMAQTFHRARVAEQDSGRYYNTLAIAADLEGQYDQALSYHRRALEIRERAALMDKVAKSHNNTAIVYRLKGDFVNASLHYEQALAIIRTQEDQKEWQAHIRRNYALAYQDHGDYQQAKQMYQQALAYWRSVGNPELIAMLEIDLQVINGLLGLNANARLITEPAQGGDTREH
jgi:tetratricopeptide (TPR) repeat protein